MNIADKDIYVCPAGKQPLQLEIGTQDADNIESGRFVSQNGHVYPITGGLPDFTFPFNMPESDRQSKSWYDANADVYDEYLPLTFKTFSEDEDDVRRKMIGKLNLMPNHRVLEVGAGTGRDSVLIAEQLSCDGELHLQDLCVAILEKSFDKMERFDVPVKFHIGNACSLPFPDNYFDASFHFGGMNTFSDINAFLIEMNRVTRHGGKVVVGDESVPEWLRTTEFGRILMNSNPHYKYGLPLRHLPINCRNVRLEWIIGGVFYVIDYLVGVGAPEADFDFEIPGIRGGTHRTRYFGHLEGITDETKKLAVMAREASGKSMHKWLDDVIKRAALKTLNKQSNNV